MSGGKVCVTAKCLLVSHPDSLEQWESVLLALFQLCFGASFEMLFSLNIFCIINDSISGMCCLSLGVLIVTNRV